MVDVSGGEQPLALRAGRPEDHAAFVRMFQALGVDDPPPSPDMWAQERAAEALFVDGPEGPRAYAVTDVLGDIGYVVNLVVDAPARGQGLGRRMMRALAARFRAQGCTRWMLNVKRDNVAALGLYTSLGMTPAREAITLRLTRAQAATLPPAPPGLAVVPVAEAEHAGLTEAWRLIPGKLGRFAAMSSHLLLRLKGEAGADALRLGMMDLRASAGVLFPFFFASPGHARALLEDAFGRVGEGTEALGVVLMDDAPMVERLKAAGATVRMETLELHGSLRDDAAA